jgi:hypothetical protein
MSTDTPAQPFAVTSLLESLPPEIIERILLEVVDYVPPVIQVVPGYGKTCRAFVGDSHSPVLKRLLAHRLVSRTLHNNSWRAFAKVIGHTIFDIRSKESVTNLSMLANVKQLAPWIQRLTISCFTPDDWYGGPYESELSADQRACIDLFHLVRTDDQDWFPAAWRWAYSDDPISSTQALAVTTEAQDLIKLLSGCFRFLSNVTEIQYHYEVFWIPARFRHCVKQDCSREVPAPLCIGSTRAGLRGCYLGLHILVETMAAVQMEPQHLDVAALVHDPHCFLALASCETIKKITPKVEQLTLRNVHDRLHSEIGPPPTGSWVAITAENFPALRSLGMDLRSLDFGTSNSPLPHPSDLPCLTSLTLLDARDSEPLLLDFVQLFKDSLKHIALAKRFGSYSYPIIALLCDLGFDVFMLGKGSITGWKSWYVWEHNEYLRVSEPSSG